jgi:CRP-like cAMP-binding protein
MLMLQDNSPLYTALRKLERHGRLSDDDRRAFLALPVTEERVRAGDHVVRQGDQPQDCALLLSGFAFRHKMTADGERQIVSFHLRGDMLDLQQLLLRRADHNVQMLTDGQLCRIPVIAFRKVCRERAAVAEALWLDSLIDASIFREWVLNVGRRDARSRIAHLLCELGTRWESAGLGPADHFELPLTQEQLADATGLTSVHVNRVLQSLGVLGLIDRERRLIKVPDWAGLQRVAGFTADYLHQEPQESVRT